MTPDTDTRMSEREGPECPPNITVGIPDLRPRRSDLIVAILAIIFLILAFSLSGCSLTPAPSPAPLQAAVWMPVDSEEIGPDFGVAVAAATWYVPQTGGYLSFPVFGLGAETIVCGPAYTVHRGGERMPMIALGAGYGAAWDGDGLHTDRSAPVVGATAAFVSAARKAKMADARAVVGAEIERVRRATYDTELPELGPVEVPVTAGWGNER